MIGNCPYCKNGVTVLHLHTLTGRAPNGTNWNCVTFSCPSCNTVLSAGIDPIAVRTDIIGAIQGKKP